MNKKKLTVEIEVEKAKNLIKDIKKHILKDSTTVVINLVCNQDKHDKSYNLVNAKVEYGGQRDFEDID